MWLMAAMVAAAVGLAPGSRVRAQEPAGMAPRTASYSIDATLDPGIHESCPPSRWNGQNHRFRIAP